MFRASARLMEKERIGEEKRQIAPMIREEVKQQRSVIPGSCDVAAGEIASSADQSRHE